MLHAAASSPNKRRGRRFVGLGTGLPCRWQFYRKYLALVRLLSCFSTPSFLLFSLRASANVPLGRIGATRSAFNAMLERGSKWKLACSILPRFIFLSFLLSRSFSALPRKEAEKRPLGKKILHLRLRLLRFFPRGFLRRGNQICVTIFHLRAYTLVVYHSDISLCTQYILLIAKL